MSVNFMGYNIARTGLIVNDKALQVTGHNISNANTTGFVRQQAIIANSNYIGIGSDGFKIGLGAGVQEIRQIRHSFADNIYRRENTNYGYWEARSNALSDVQTILGEPVGDGLQDSLNQFWDSWQEVSKEPDSLIARALVRQRGESLVSYINHMGQQINKLQEDINTELNVRIDEINNITKNIADLNLAITKSITAGNTPNDYLDQRNVLIDKLTYLAGVDSYEYPDGQVDIIVGGHFLVSKSTQTKLYSAESEPGSIYYVPKLEGTDYTVKIKNGYIKGLLEARGSEVGSKGSLENGTPNNLADITIAVDVSSGSGENLSKIKAQINEYVKQLKNSGLNYNLRLVTYSDNAAINATVWNKNNIDDAGTGFMDTINALTEDASTTNNFGDVITNLNGITDFREDATKFMMVFTNESIGGDEVDDEAQVSGYVDALNTLGIKTSVVTDSSYFNGGAPAGEVSGWSKISDGTDGSLYDINSSDFSELMKTINDDINDKVDEVISYIEPTTSIISDLKKRLNALINIVAREVNSLHSNGLNLRGDPGENFFVPVSDEYPMEMGNIKLNDNLLDLNNIVAGNTGANGDNTISLKIANLRNADLYNDYKGTMSVDGYYRNIVEEVANSAGDAVRIAENQRKLVNSADDYRNSIMAVSMDEEMTNMMKFKFAYNAASKVMNSIDQMIETLVNRTGLVGR